jgi:hypothetical protein
MSPFCTIPPITVGYISNFVKAKDAVPFFTTNKYILTSFSIGYKSPIIDIKDMYYIVCDHFKETSVFNRKCMYLFIKIHIESLFEKLKIPIKYDSPILPILYKCLDLYNIAISYYIIDPTLMDVINYILEKGIYRSKIKSYAPGLLPLYKQNKKLINILLDCDIKSAYIKEYANRLSLLYRQNKKLMDKLLDRSTRLGYIITYTKKLSLLYRQNNKLIDKLLETNVYLQDIEEYAIGLLPLYTQDNKFIDKLLERNVYFKDIKKYAPELLSYYTQDNKLIDKLLERNTHLVDMKKYAQIFLLLYTQYNRELIDKLLESHIHSEDIEEYAKILSLLYTQYSRELIDILLEIHIHPRNIEEYAKILLLLYTQYSRELIDILLEIHIHPRNIEEYVSELSLLYTEDNREFVNKLFQTGYKDLADILKYAPTLLQLYTEDKKLIDILLENHTYLGHIKPYFKKISLLYTEDNRKFVNKLFQTKYRDFPNIIKYVSVFLEIYKKDKKQIDELLESGKGFLDIEKSIEIFSR